MKPHEQNVTLRRNCAAAQIPSGSPTTLSAGEQVRITQSLGGTYTVLTQNGYLVRIASKDADALGLQSAADSPAPVTTTPQDPAEIERLVWDQLRTCYDPEIPVNIVELGLVYRCNVTPITDGKHKVSVKFTLTAPGCGMGDVLRVDIENKVLGVPGVEDVEVEVVFEPPWDQDMMSEAAKLDLGML
jgi:probable FeS assembly SUF system protein SufT